MQQIPMTQEECEKIKAASFSEITAILNLPLEYDREQLLTNYQHLYLENLKEKKIEQLSILTIAKFVLNRDLACREVAENGKFDHSVVPFDKPCKDCSGAGELWKFFKTTAETECKFCEGEGIRVIPCRACNETGRFVKTQANLKINVKCNKCNKKDESTGVVLVGKIRVKCRSCRGSGIYRRLVIDSSIKSTTFCKTCKGKGFMYKKEKEPTNPVLSEDIGKKLKDAVVPQE